MFRQTITITITITITRNIKEAYYYFYYFPDYYYYYSQPRLNIFTVGNMRVMICLGQGGLRSLSASSLPLDLRKCEKI